MAPSCCQVVRMELAFVPVTDALADPRAPHYATLRGAMQGFDCGAERWAQPLNNYLRDGHAVRDHAALVASTYLVFDEASDLVGYVTLAWTQIDTTQDLRALRGLRRVPYATLPALLLSRLAIQRQHQARGAGTAIVAWVRDLADALPVACRFIALHVAAENNAAIAFYGRQGFFIQGGPNDRHLVLMLSDLRG